MDRVQQPLALDNYGLHLYATAGDDEGVQRALDAGANVNTLDASGRSVVMCAVAGDHWETIDASDASFMTPRRLHVLRMLLARPEISLYTLNLPQTSMNGVIPLGMAAWLGFPEAVRTLLESSSSRICVDGMDSHGATALMYAARDGNLAVVKLLLSHGARPDFRDLNHRTSVQFALPHPHILWLCELVLRRHRWRESENPQRSRLYSNEPLLDLMSPALPSSDSLESPPPSVFTVEALKRQTQTIISSITSSDLPFLYSLLFSPPPPPNSPPSLYPMSVPLLVNHPDREGWSPIHHCVAVEHPSIEILDALYCAGADVSLFTEREQWTPLHVLAHSAVKSEDPEQALALFEFSVHLVRDLRAPLSARDKDDETCIHIAAEHGASMEILIILLDCDTTGVVREMKNSRGLTALEVCKEEFRAAFGEDAEKFRSASALSARTIRPTESYSSLATLSDWNSTVYASSSQSVHARGNSPLIPNQQLPPSPLSPTTPTVPFASVPKVIQNPSEVDVVTNCHQLVSNLRITSPPSLQLSASTFTFAQLSHYDSLLTQTDQLAISILSCYRQKLEEAAKEFEMLRGHYKSIVELHLGVSLDINQKLVDDGRDPLPWIMSKRGSEDSETTAVSCEPVSIEKALGIPKNPIVKETLSPNGHGTSKTARLKALFSSSTTHLLSSSSLPEDSRNHATNTPVITRSASRDDIAKRQSSTHVSVGTQTYLFDFLDVHGISNCDLSATQWPEWFDDVLRHRDDPTGIQVTQEEKVLIGKLLDAEREIQQYEKKLLAAGTTIPWAISDRHRSAPISDPAASSALLSAARDKDPKIKQLLKKKKRIEEKINELVVSSSSDASAAGSKTGTSKFKAWIKKKLDVMHERGTSNSGSGADKLPAPKRKVEIVFDLDESNCNVGREVSGIPNVVISPVGDDESGDSPAFVFKVNEFDPVVENALKTSKSVLGAARKDLMSISQCLKSVDKHLDLANRSVSRFDRVIKRACKNRQTILSHLRQRLDYELNQSDIFVRPRTSSGAPSPRLHSPFPTRPTSRPSTAGSGSPGLLGFSEHLTLSTKPSMVSIASMSSISSYPAPPSPHGLSNPGTPSPPHSPASDSFEINDDEDTRIIRRLLLRKVEASIGGAWDEMDKVVTWLRIVKEAIRGVKRRAYL
ncbi:hypothetical protein AX16_010731 [Volvariella volvacea WC 439]|nr:hypothetical protein AX16_010731 [Volvariella volvacea WC 439]